MVSAPFQVPESSTGVPRFLPDIESRYRAFAGNLADLLLRRGPRGPQVEADFWPDIFVRQGIPVAGLRQSVLWHVLAIAAVWGLTIIWVGRPNVRFQKFSPKNSVAYYPASEYLPQIGTPSPAAKLEQKGQPEYSPQPIISLPRLPDNTRQTIVDPSTVKVLTNDAKLPNLVAWNNVPLAAAVTPGSRSTSQLTLPWQVPKPVAPAPENTDRRISDLAAHAPEPSVVQPAPMNDSVKRRLGDLNIAASATAVAPPKLEVAPQRAAAKPEPPPPAPDLQGVSGTGASASGQLIALTVRPQAPSGPIEAPGGNRSGTFAATPEGKPGAPGTPDIPGGGSAANGGVQGHGAASRVPAGIYVGPPARAPSAVASKPAQSGGQNKLLAALTHPAPMSSSIRTAPPPTMDAPSNRRVEDEVFGSKRYYSMILNMPNLTSAGGSWIVRYAELKQDTNDGGLVPPVATQKADPAYPADSIRDGVEGTVVLYAVIHSDGRVSDVRVLRSVDERLDASARAALANWHFRPATKGGTPIALETVVHIPFALPKRSF